MLTAMGFSFASVVLSYFLIAGGTFFAALFAGRIGLHSEYLGYIILALGGFLGGIVAARASKGSTIIEPAIGAALLLVSLIGVGLAASGHADIMLMPNTMKAIGLTAAASAGGGIGGAFVTEKLFGDSGASPLSWVLYVGVAAFGAGVIGTTFGAFLGHGSGGALFGMLALCRLLVGIATGASATSRPLGASFLGGALGLGRLLLPRRLRVRQRAEQGERRARDREGPARGLHRHRDHGGRRRRRDADRCARRLGRRRQQAAAEVATGYVLDVK
jgi:hypothetical protein